MYTPNKVTKQHLEVMFRSQLMFDDVVSVFHGSQLATSYLTHIESMIKSLAQYRHLDRPPATTDDKISRLCAKLADCLTLTSHAQGVDLMKKKLAERRVAMLA